MPGRAAVLSPLSAATLARGAALLCALAGAELAALALLAPVLDLAGLLDPAGRERLATLTDWAGGLDSGGPGALVGAWLLASALVSLLRRQQALFAGRLREAACRAWQERVHAAVLAADWAWLVGRRHADLNQALAQEAPRAADALGASVSALVQLALLAVHLGLAAWLAPGLTLVAVATGGALVLLLQPLRARARRAGERLTMAGRGQQRGIADLLGAGRTLRAHGEEQRARDRLRAVAGEASAARLDALASAADATLVLELGAAAALAGCVGVAHVALVTPPGLLLLLLVIYARVLRRAGALHATAVAALGSAPAARALEALLEELRGHARAREPEVSAPAPLRLERELRAEGLGFTCPGRATPVLAGIDLTLRAGELLLLTGPSGAGKTTLADLLLGLLAPSRGCVTVDGVPLGPATLPAWRRAIAYVPQDPHLLPGSARENLVWSCPGAAEEDLWGALDAVDLAERIRALPGGLDAPLGERGGTLSGGERQRLAIACALLRAPSFLVLDEATSGLDLASEARLLGAIAARPELTTLAITHRPAPALPGARVVRLEELARPAVARELVGAA